MKFRTEVTVTPNPDFVSYKTEMLSLGSCFADEIGMRLAHLQFSMLANPFGVIFNPVSMADVLNNALKKDIQQNLFVQRNGHWYHYGYHSELHATDKTELAQKIEVLNGQVKTKLLNGNLLVLTFGTAWVYRHLETNNVVANCHKIPQKQFSKELLDPDPLKEIYVDLFERLFKENPGLKVLLTVSPVRHIKDGMHENNLSKSVLHLLARFLVNRFEQVHYFPAYELVVDDLRDYRFYKTDLIHPTDQAVDYVFEKFTNAYFSNQTKEGAAIQQALLLLKAHKRKTPDASEDNLVQQKIETLENQFSHLKLK